MTRPNVFEAGFEYDPADPEGYRSGVACVGRLAGGTENTVKLFEVPPGQSICPYHYEYTEEWLLVLDGPVELRAPDGTGTLERGALVCFPRGPEGAHKVTNRGERPATVLMFSSSREPAVAVYPDSAKVGVWPGGPEDELMLRRTDGNVGYFEGET
ncbi:MAG: cupin domain-containing protein [Solirubrobacteraceae bacterium]